MEACLGLSISPPQRAVCLCIGMIRKIMLSPQLALQVCARYAQQAA